MGKPRIKYQSVTVNLAAGQAAQAFDTDADMDQSYKRCTGIWISEKSDGDLINNYKVGLRDDNGDILPVANGYLAQADRSVTPNEKFLEIDFEIFNGQGLKIVTTTGAATATDALNFTVTFRLEGHKNPNA